MTKRELLKKMDGLLEEKGMKKIEDFNGKISERSNKAEIASAIKCLEATDEEMRDYLTVIKIKFPNIYRVVVDNGNWLTHSYNRLYIYSTAKTILSA